MHVVETNDDVCQRAESCGAAPQRCRSEPPRRHSGRRPAGRRSLATLVLLVAVSTAASGCRPPACSEPFPAVMWQEDVPDSGPWPEGGTDRPPPRSVFDSDGDGLEDTVDGATGDVVLALTVHRDSGDLSLTSESGVVAPVHQLGSDHDGDGRSEIIVSSALPTGDLGPTYVIPGSTPDGSHDLSDVGIHLVDDWLPSNENRVGDLDGDGADELVFTGEFETWVFPGAEMMAAGPGDDSPTSPIVLSAALVDPVQVNPSLYAMVLVDDAADEVILQADGAELRFSTTNSGLPLVQADFDRMGASIVDGPDGAAWLVVWIAGDGGRLTSRWAWDIDSLCDGPTPPTIHTGDGS